MLPARWIESGLEFRDIDGGVRTVTIRTEMDEIDEFRISVPLYILNFPVLSSDAELLCLEIQSHFQINHKHLKVHHSLQTHGHDAEFKIALKQSQNSFTDIRFVHIFAC